MSAMDGNGTLIHFSNKNGRTSKKEREFSLLIHSIHPSNEQNTANTRTIDQANWFVRLLAQNFNPKKKQQKEK
jgi:hypothetical protein